VSLEVVVGSRSGALQQLLLCWLGFSGCVRDEVVLCYCVINKCYVCRMNGGCAIVIYCVLW